MFGSSDGRGQTRSSVLWGGGNRGGDHRASALWGKGGRGRAALVFMGLALLAPIGALAGSGPSANAGKGNGVGKGTYVAPGLLEQATKNPGQKVHLIVTSTDGASVAKKALNGLGLGSVRKSLDLVSGVAVDIPASKLDKLAAVEGLTITPDSTVKVSGLSSKQLWPYESGVSRHWYGLENGSPVPDTPTIAIVDSGVDPTRPDIAGRLITQINLSSLTPNATGDGRGHGTFVAGIAAGAAPGYAGASPNSKILSIRVMDDNGMARTSDVIAACQWILDNKDTYNIRIANFSLHSGTPGHFVTDPLDKAVEKLWFAGVTVVAAAGNYGVNGQPVRMAYAPGNDPFVITVGAVDLGGTIRPRDDFAPPWSAYGYSYDGFAKPDLAAPGRYMIGPIPAGSTLAVQKAANLVGNGYIQLSGTSFAAPIVSGAAAQILARHPQFTPDQVKGALLATAKDGANFAPLSVGAGELNAARAANVINPPNPNLALNRFVVAASNSPGRVFDAAAWEATVKSSTAWDAATWTDATWTDATWTDATWTDATWTDATWTDATWTDAVWTDATWTDASYEDAAEGDANLDGGYPMTPEEMAALQADPDLALPTTAPDPASVPPAGSTTTTTSASTDTTAAPTDTSSATTGTSPAPTDSTSAPPPDPLSTTTGTVTSAQTVPIP